MSCSWTFLLNPNQPKSNFSSDLRTAHSNIFLCLLSFKVAKAGDYHFAVFKQRLVRHPCSWSNYVTWDPVPVKAPVMFASAVILHCDSSPCWLGFTLWPHWSRIYLEVSCLQLDSDQREDSVVLSCKCFCLNALETIDGENVETPKASELSSRINCQTVVYLSLGKNLSPLYLSTPLKLA